ncbi:Protein NPC2 -like protein [Trichinella pseudospiralis]|uniref:Protein NPC2-like protein n=1 Tax=Trichinella pseudospiralis TaxID=6337 RepID=A0A0V1J3C2_TRIPS|nr:Protein NPC2 -like protein [Trichinella pseudospiralis]
MPRLFQFFIFLIICSVVQSIQINFTDCGSHSTIESVSASPCDDPYVCIVKRGDKISTNVTFVPHKKISRLILKSYAKINKISFTVAVPDYNGCKDHGLKCPLNPEVSVTYQRNVTIAASTPLVTAVLRSQLKDQNNLDVFCIESKIKVVLK